MSICALTSKGQDPAEWSNYFNGGALQIPENAELCVIGGSVQRNNKTDDNIVVNEENNSFVLHYGTSSAATRCSRTNCFGGCRVLGCRSMSENTQELVTLLILFSSEGRIKSG